jgi:hypothetical protein
MAAPPPSSRAWPGSADRRSTAARVARRDAAPTSGPRRPSRPGRRRPEPDRRDADGRRIGISPGCAAGQPQARTAPDARTRPAAAGPLRAASAPAWLLPGHPARRALALGHDVDLGRRARLVLPERRDRLLHPRDHRLGARRPLPRARGRRRRRPRGRRSRHRSRLAHARHRQRDRVHQPRLLRPPRPARDHPRRGGYRDPENQAFIESWFSKLKQRCVWREEFETLDQARAAIAGYIERYHHRPHSNLAYRTPREVASTWQHHRDDLTPAA